MSELNAQPTDLKAGVTKSNVGAMKSQLKKPNLTKMAGGATKIGGGISNQKKANKSRMKTSTSERDNEIVKY